MKKILLVTLLCNAALLSFAAPITKTTATKPVNDSSFIYIYRVGQFGGALANFSVYLDGKKLCKLSNNKFFRIPVTKGSHTISSKVGGMSMFKKETDVEIEATKGGEYYIACNMKSSITRVRLEMIEVTKGTGTKQLQGMTEDNCQNKIDKDE